MNWISVKKEVPEFERVVLLFGTLKGRSITTVGWLQSVDKNGYNFRTDKDIIGMEIFNTLADRIVVTHWCEIGIPNTNIEENE